MNAASPAPLFDAHNHLHDAWLEPHRPAIFGAWQELGVQRAVVNGTCENDWADVAALARENAVVLPSFGLHPWDVGNATPQWRDHLQRTLDQHPHAALGEIGLDRWILDRARPDDPRLAGLRRAPLEEQLDAFRWQLHLALERNLPVTIHCLEAWGAMRDTLLALPRLPRGFLLHAYGGSADLAREFTELGAFYSFNGAFLAERQQAKRETFRALPLERVLVETDAPAMPLPPGRRTHSLPDTADGNVINHPANLRAAYAGLAEIRGLAESDLVGTVARNFSTLFGAAAALPG